jgi:hypothetical protein
MKHAIHKLSVIIDQDKLLLTITGKLSVNNEIHIYNFMETVIYFTFCYLCNRLSIEVIVWISFWKLKKKPNHVLISLFSSNFNLKMLKNLCLTHIIFSLFHYLYIMNFNLKMLKNLCLTHIIFSLFHYLYIMNLLVTESQDDLFILFFEQLIQQLQLKNEISIPYIPKEIIINICSHMNSKNNDFKHNDVCCNRCSPLVDNMTKLVKTR